MYGYILGSTFLKSLNPYFRKHVLTSLTPREYFYLNSTFVFLTVLIVFFLFETRDSCLDIWKNYQKLKITQIVSMLIIAIVLVTSSLMIYELDKKYNTPLINSMLLRGASLILLIVVGVFIFGENYNWKQWTGMLLILSGIYLIST